MTILYDDWDEDVLCPCGAKAEIFMDKDGDPLDEPLCPGCYAFQDIFTETTSGIYEMLVCANDNCRNPIDEYDPNHVCTVCGRPLCANCNGDVCVECDSRFPYDDGRDF